jgi:hypothetical protein
VAFSIRDSLDHTIHFDFPPDPVPITLDLNFPAIIAWKDKKLEQEHIQLILSNNTGRS